MLKWIIFELFAWPWHTRSPHNASWKYIEAIADHYCTIPYGEMSCEWMNMVYRRARNIKRIRAEK